MRLEHFKLALFLLFAAMAVLALTYLFFELFVESEADYKLESCLIVGGAK